LIRSEPKFGGGRFDFELAKGRKKMLVEVKSVSLVEDGVAPPTAGFPDAPTERGRRHLVELADAVSQGYKASVIFMVTRNDAALFQPHAERDPEFAETLKMVAEQGVKIHCFKCDIDIKKIALSSKIPVRFC
jgi:sugar fermentation stimulation protein A